MQSFLVHTLGFSPAAAAKFEADGGSLDSLARMRKEDCPSAHMWARLNQSRDELHRLRVAAPLQKWAEKWKARDFLRRATARELRWTLDENPFYPCVAYGVPYDACADLGVPCGDEARRKHAWLCDQIRRGGGSVAAAEVAAELGGADVLGVAPVDLTRHPLFGRDVERTPRAELVRLGGLEGAGEVRRATNDLRLTPEGRYVRGRAGGSAAELAACIRGMLTT